MSRVVGIDLGTTHTALAWAEPGVAPEAMAIPQLVARSQLGERTLLPSCLHAPLEGEPHDDPWQAAPWVGGEYARLRDAEVPGRTITSAKSWLCHAAVDRERAILPWGADADAPKLSPVDVSARLLSHLARAWESKFPGRSLSGETLVLTVPASFDEVARELTLRAAQQAGLSPTLLEEPQAAFYDYLRNEDELRALARDRGGRADVLVCDVGGGTTDLSVIRATLVGSELTFERVAVGRHVLLGGDNMDLALAHLVEPRLSRGAKLDSARFAQLVLACRGAKERLLGDAAPESVSVSLLSRGSSLVGAVARAELTRDEARALLLDGFFPLVGLDAGPAARPGLATSSLPYERDPAITRHVHRFVRKHLEAGGRVDAVLPNGGVFHSPEIVRRLGRLLPDAAMLPAADPDLAVARGAVRHGLAKLGVGARVVAGSSRAFFVGVAGAEARAVCVLPKGAHEGEAHAAVGSVFELLLNAPIRFDLYARDESGDRAGDVVALDDTLVKLAPLTAQFGGARSGASKARVGLEAELAVTGTLCIACVEEAPPRQRHVLALDLRSEAPRSLPPPSAPPGKLDAARATVDAVFGKAGSNGPKDLLRDLERSLGERSSWDAATARALFDALARAPGSRRRSAEHERVFFSLAGTCLRPGYGAPGDEARAALMGRLFHERLGFPDEARGWAQFFIALRRVAGGLDEATQTAMRDLFDGALAPKEKKVARNKKFQPRAEGELIELAASLERVPPERRAELGEWLLERTWVAPSPGLWASIGRLGARVPTYASVHHVVPPAIAERWLDHLLRAGWSALATAPLAAARMARMTGDRTRDVGERARKQTLKKLEDARAQPELVRAVTEVVLDTEAERADFYGESLPLGLTLVRDDD